MNYDTIVIGGGPTGLASAISVKELGLNPLILETNEDVGGVLPQCIHPGFGLQYYREELTGPEFAHRLVGEMNKHNIECVTNSFVLEIRNTSPLEKIVRYVSPAGAFEAKTRTVIYTAGLRERHQFELNIVGDRTGGVYTAGEAQTLMDIHGIMPGKRIVIVGSGDIGMIMARRFALEGAKVEAVIEMMPYPGGLTRNVVQCLKDFEIPLHLSHKIVAIKGKKRVEKVVVAAVDENLCVKKERHDILCDTVIISAGLVPMQRLLEDIGVLFDPSSDGPIVNELMETSVGGVFVAGNSLLVNDLVDYAVEQGNLAALGVKTFVKNQGVHVSNWKTVEKGRNIRTAVPQYLSGDRDAIIYARVSRPEQNVRVSFPDIGKQIKVPTVRPSEMFRIKLKRDEIAKAKERILLEVISNE